MHNDPADLAADQMPHQEWAFVLPAGWWTIPLADPKKIEPAVRALVVERLGRRDDMAQPRKDARENLLKAAKAAAAEGGAQLTTFGMDIAGIMVTGTMAVYAIERNEAGEKKLEKMVADAAGRALTHRQETPEGTVVRAVEASAIHRKDENDEPILPELRVDYWVDREDLSEVMYLVFTTPFVPLQEAMVELFDAVTASLHLVDVG